MTTPDETQAQKDARRVAREREEGKTLEQFASRFCGEPDFWFTTALPPEQIEERIQKVLKGKDTDAKAT